MPGWPPGARRRVARRRGRFARRAGRSLPLGFVLQKARLFARRGPPRPRGAAGPWRRGWRCAGRVAAVRRAGVPPLRPPWGGMGGGPPAARSPSALRGEGDRGRWGARGTRPCAVAPAWVREAGRSVSCFPSVAVRTFIVFPQAPGARSALLFFPSVAGRSLRTFAPSSAGRSLRSLGSAPGGAPARSRRPGRCAARSRSALAPGWPPCAACVSPSSRAWGRMARTGRRCRLRSPSALRGEGARGGGGRRSRPVPVAASRSAWPCATSGEVFLVFHSVAGRLYCFPSGAVALAHFCFPSDEAALPAAVFSPVLLRALRRLAAICLLVATMLPFLWGETDHRGPRHRARPAHHGAGCNGRLFCFPSGAGRSLRSLGLRALRRAGAVAPAGPLRGPVPLGSDAQLAAGRLLGSHRAPPRAWTRDAYAPCGPVPLTSHALGAAGGTQAAPPCSPSPPLGAERAGVRWGELRASSVLDGEHRVPEE